MTLKKDVGPLVVGLLNWSGPTAVVRFVVPVVVFPVERMASGWSRSHIRDEVVKRSPTVTNSDSTLSVIGITRCIGIRATVEHSSPDSVFRQVGLTVRRASLDCD